MISSNKAMISACFTRQGFVSIEARSETERFNSAFVAETILPRLVQSASLLPLKMQAQDYQPHIRQCYTSQFCSVSS
jgi:hypothetical protein